MPIFIEIKYFELSNHINYVNIRNNAPIKKRSEKHHNHEGKLPKSHRKSYVKFTLFGRDPQEAVKKRTPWSSI